MKNAGNCCQRCFFPDECGWGFSMYHNLVQWQCSDLVPLGFPEDHLISPGLWKKQPFIREHSFPLQLSLCSPICVCCWLDSHNSRPQSLQVSTAYWGRLVVSSVICPGLHFNLKNKPIKYGPRQAGFVALKSFGPYSRWWKYFSSSDSLTLTHSHLLLVSAIIIQNRFKLISQAA